MLHTFKSHSIKINKVKNKSLQPIAHQSLLDYLPQCHVEKLINVFRNTDCYKKPMYLFYFQIMEAPIHTSEAWSSIKW